MKYLLLLLLYLPFNLQAQIQEKRKEYGQLNDLDFSKLKSNLSDQVVKADLILIIYYPGKDKCNGMERVSTWNVFDHDFIPQLNSIARIKPFWVYKNDENLKYFHPKEVKWRLDEEQLIEKTFFIKPYPCFSFVAIDKTGRYISIFGEFGKQQVWKVCEELLNFK